MNAAIGLPATKRVITRHSGPSELVTFSTFVSALVAWRRKRFELCTAILFSGVMRRPMDETHATAYLQFLRTLIIAVCLSLLFFRSHSIGPHRCVANGQNTPPAMPTRFFAGTGPQ